ncbi:MAG TPA: DUF3306 domain-containing protein [Polaromonas sp.]|uniref:DUF3306 domain-containing protein n=1 Tax=Polaromonas sp. UBA4122 TaxID=1947074 RepID=UPI000EE1C844|nr:DUF3306 domain-containing protein [Polaromonas sp. UBA4122]HAL37355.1 DUF3306 domain-containing protein [Polaromonas sp.]
MVEEARGFLGRWARRKTDALHGKPLEEPAAVAKPGAMDSAGVQIPISGSAESMPAVLPLSGATAAASEAEQPEKIALSLDDVKLLTKDSDFKPFMARDVGPEVRNAAMKKLFADPHFNVMDGLDIYIDDYSKSDPIPESMLRQMVGAKFLKLFDDEEKDEKQNDLTSSPRENANNPNGETVAQSSGNSDLGRPDPINPEHSSQPAPLPDAGASPQDHAHTHLRLQPDHASTAPDAGRDT